MSEAKLVEVTASLMNGKEKIKEHTILFDFGSTVEEAIEKFTAEVVHSNFVRASKVTCQAALRRLMEAGKSDEEIDTAMAAWKPGVALERTIDPEAALLAKFGKMDAAQQAAFIAELQARRASAPTE
jgi:hypothetical protein